MKKILLLLLLTGFVLIAQAQIPLGVGYNKIYSRYTWLAGGMDSGFHLPGYATVPNKRTSVWTGSGNIGIDTVNHRQYFYSDTWIRLANFSEIGSAAWSLTGNASTTPGTNFLGTTDGQALQFRTNGALRLSLPAIELQPGASTDSILVKDGSGVIMTRAQSDVTGVNIYNSDGSLTGARRVTLGTNNLTFSGNRTNSRFILDSMRRITLSSLTGNDSSYAQLTLGRLVGTADQASLTAEDTSWKSHIILEGTTATMKVSPKTAYSAGSGSEIRVGYDNVIELDGDTILVTSLPIRTDMVNQYLVTWDTSTIVANQASRLWAIDPALIGGGNVTKVGTPVNNQVGVWTGDGTIEGDADLTFDGTNMVVGGNITSSGGNISSTTGFIGGSSVQVDGSEVFNTSGTTLQIGLGGFTTTTLGSGASFILQFVGTSGSFPALQRSGADLMVVDASGGSASRLGIGVAPVTTLHVAGSFTTQQGADVASANNLAVVANLTEITGATQVNLLSSTGWVNGSIVTLMFSSTPTVKNGQATSGSNITILLAGAADFVASADDLLTLQLGEIGGVVAWREKGRSVN